MTKTKKLTVWLDDKTYNQLEGVAVGYKVSKNKAIEKLIQEGLKVVLEGASHSAVDALTSEVRQASEQARGALEAQVTRLSHLIIRGLLESIATRQMMRVQMSGQLDRDQLRQVSEDAWSSAVKSLKNPTPAMRQSIRDLVPDTDALTALDRKLDALMNKLEEI